MFVDLAEFINIQESFETSAQVVALPVVMNLSASTRVNNSSVPGTSFKGATQVVPMLEPKVLPQTQAGLVSWSGPALCPDSEATWIPMTTRSFDREHAPKDDRDEHQSARTKIGTGARAVNRLLLSLWFLLIPMIWPSSDWIGLIILSQALFVAANLIRPAITNSSAAVSPEGTVVNLNHGEERAEG